MAHPIWSNIFKLIGKKRSEAEIALKQVPIFEDLNRRENLKAFEKLFMKESF